MKRDPMRLPFMLCYLPERGPHGNSDRRSEAFYLVYSLTFSR